MGATEELTAKGLPVTEEDGTLKPELNYTIATRKLAERQLASCAREFTTADLKAEKGVGLSDAAVDRLLGGPASASTFSEEDFAAYDKAIREEVSHRQGGTAILRIQVHNIPHWPQIVYMIAVVVVMVY